MKSRVAFLILAFSAFVLLSWHPSAQALHPERERGTPSAGPVVDSYYKLEPGKTDEWLELYRTQHLPILKERQKQGEIVDIVIYRPVLHQGAPAWDYKVTLVWRDFAAFGDNAGQLALERRLFPDWERHRQAERRRWEITAHHWDDLMVEVTE
jgi:hypothetical protein